MRVVIPTAESNHRRQDSGLILAVGPLAELEVGQRVAFKAYAAEAARIDDVEYLIVDESDVTAVLDLSPSSEPDEAV